MADEQDVWRPLGVDSDEQIAEYDALHDGVPSWMAAEFWEWMGFAIHTWSAGVRAFDTILLMRMGQALHIPIPNMDGWTRDGILQTLRSAKKPLQIADYLLAYGTDTHGGLHDAFDRLLTRSNSKYRVGPRDGRPGLVERVPEGVQVAADAVMGGAGRAGVRLAKAWELLYGLDPNPSEAYRHAILAIEDAAIPVVQPKHKTATLGSVIGQMAGDPKWSLPMLREPANAPTKDVVPGLMRVVWEGQHDRHGGNDEPEKPGNVSHDEATVAVLAAVALVGWFDAGLVARK